ncbi:MAG: MMPL family transporter, partial [Oscillospiraceae bacterium]
MLSFIARLVTKRPWLVLLIAAGLLIPSAVCALATHINYDILSYLPPDLDSSKGERVLEDTFHNAATTMLIVEDMPPAYAEKLRGEVEQVEGVSSAVWISNFLDVSIPQEILPDSIRELFYSDHATMMIVQYEHAGATDETMHAIDAVRTLCNEQCFLAGFSVLVRDTRALVDQEMPLYVALAVLLSMLAMSVTIDAWILPLAFLLSIGCAVVYNMGSNILLGEISYVTKAIAAILQLGVTMDYSIFLFHRYAEEKQNCVDRHDAMAKAVQSAFLSLAGSSLTTVAGFLALCFMRLLLGRDIGIVMAKGVVMGVLTVLLVLPSLLLVLDGPIERWHHRTLIPDFQRINRFMIAHRKAFVGLFVLLFVPFVYAQQNVKMYYNLDKSLPQDLPSIVATNRLKDEFHMASTHFVIVDDTLPPARLTEMVKQIEKVDGIASVVAYNKLLGAAIPDEFIPDAIRDVCKKDGLQMMMINSNYKAASEEAAKQIDTLTSLVRFYDPNALMTGEAVMTQDLIDTASVDFRVTNYISIAAILLIVGCVFSSATVPILLVATIELAIFINQGIPFFTGTVIPFISPTVVGCIQLGATVDYAILMATRFREEVQNGHDRFQAIEIAANACDPAIITSSLVLFFATMGVGLISKIQIISSICIM